MKIMFDRRIVASLAAGAVMLSATACTQGSASPSAAASTGGGGGTTVAVTLQEWAVVPEAASAPAGDVTFEITNNGPADVHEFVVMKTDLDPGDLPVDENGMVDESGEGIDEVIGEVEEVAVDATENLTVTLEAGSYVLLCNIFDETEGEAHYTEGMRIAFTVT